MTKKSKPMELHEFIKNMLVDIHKGVQNANIALTPEGKALGKDAAAVFTMEHGTAGEIAFDVAVTVSKETKQAGGGKIEIVIADLGGEISGISTQQYVSRIRFQISPVSSIA